MEVTPRKIKKTLTFEWFSIGLRPVTVNNGFTGRRTGTGPARRHFLPVILRVGYGTGAPVDGSPVPGRIRLLRVEQNHLLGLKDTMPHRLP